MKYQHPVTANPDLMKRYHTNLIANLLRKGGKTLHVNVRWTYSLMFFQSVTHHWSSQSVGRQRYQSDAVGGDRVSVQWLSESARLQTLSSQFLLHSSSCINIVVYIPHTGESGGFKSNCDVKSLKVGVV